MIKTENKYFIYDSPKRTGLKLFIKQCCQLLLFVLYKVVFLFTKKRIKNKKYKVAICAIFKNEATYLKEWLEYHLIVGVEHFYLYNNFSNDNYLEVLEPYIKKGIVDLYEWPIPQGQCKAYYDCLDKKRDESEWIGFIDLDEFVVPNRHNNIYDFLKTFQKKYPVVIVYWKLFGTSGKIDRNRSSLVTEDFTIAWKKYTNIGKFFFNTMFEYNQNYNKNDVIVHSMWGSNKGVNLPPVDCFKKLLVSPYFSKGKEEFPIQINHYFTKSFKEYIEKSSRGDAVFEQNPRNLDYFYYHEMKCEKEDYAIFKYLIKLKQAIK